MRKTNVHTVTYVKNYTASADGLLSATGGGDYTQFIDLPKRLSERFGRNMPACATYEIRAIRLWITFNPSENVPSWSRMLGGTVYWMEPTNERVKAIKSAAREFFGQREATYGRQRQLQFYPRLTSDPVNVAPAVGASAYTAVHMSRKLTGQYFTLAPLAGGATSATDWAILREWNRQNPPNAEPVEQTGSLAQDSRLFDQRAYESIESVRLWRAWLSHRMSMERAEAAGFQDGAIIENWSWTMASGTGSLTQSEIFAPWRDQPNQEPGLVLGPLDVMLGQLVVFPERAYPRLSASQSTFIDTANRQIGLITEVDVTGWREMY